MEASFFGSALIQPFQWDLRKRTVVLLARFIGVYRFHPTKAKKKKKRPQNTPQNASAALRFSKKKKKKSTLFQCKQNAFQVSHTSGVARHSAAFQGAFSAASGWQKPKAKLESTKYTPL